MAKSVTAWVIRAPPAARPSDECVRRRPGRSTRWLFWHRRDDITAPGRQPRWRRLPCHAAVTGCGLCDRSGEPGGSGINQWRGCGFSPESLRELQKAGGAAGSQLGAVTVTPVALLPGSPPTMARAWWPGTREVDAGRGGSARKVAATPAGRLAGKCSRAGTTAGSPRYTQHRQWRSL